MLRMAKSKTGAQRVQRRRDKLRAAGLRPVQLWVPDTRAPGFAAECRRQCALLASHSNRDLDDNAWLDALNREMADDLDRDGL